ncbi:arsenate reductase ArsC [Aquabacter cavernae]|uniref:arsenate reductase ArsC n=1 Tax=Aquabacter cavernae TaxID=2496029 RepID=UPI000F8C95BD|nr:arsenate reductase ArsC [Aquabacter cavernae]
MTEAQDIQPYNVLFLSTGSAGRSVMAAAILNRHAGDRFRAFAAGTDADGTVNPFAIDVLDAEDFETQGLRFESVETFTGPGAPEMDFIFTLCDDAAGEDLPEWPGDPATAHWGIENPAKVEGSPIEKERAFETAFHYLRNRVLAFAALPLKTLDHLSLHSHLHAIGQQEGTTQPPKAG